MRTSVPSIAHIPARVSPVRARWTDIVARLELMWRVSRERNHLKALDDRMLKDIGLDRGQVEAETGKSFFDVPKGRD